MEIVDRYGYLEDALGYIEKNIIANHNIQKLAKKAGVDEFLLKNLQKGLQHFSEKLFFTTLQEELEDRHSSLLGATAELVFADVKIEVEKNKAFVLACLNWDITIDSEKEDKMTTLVKIFSDKNIQIKIVQ